MQNEINNKKQLKLKLWFRFLIALIILSCFISSIFIMKLGFDYSKSAKEEYVYSYNIDQNINYKVYLYDNSFIDDEYLTQGNMFVSELVKNIMIDFNYDFAGNMETSLEYNYSIKGKLVAEYSNGTDSDNNIWSKDYIFVDNISKVAKDSLRVLINEKIDLEFPKFNAEVKAFKNKFSLFINSKIDIIMDITINGVVEQQQFNDTKQLLISVPLGIQAFTIKEDYLPSFSKNINKTVSNININNYIYLGIFIMVISILAFTLLFKKIFNITKQTNYNKKLNHILKNYGEVIVEIKNQIDESKYKIMEVKDIEEMIDLEQELRIPINYYEITKNHLGLFILVHNDLLYKYTLTDDN